MRLLLHTTFALATVEAVNVVPFEQLSDSLCEVAPQYANVVKASVQVAIVIIHLIIALKKNKQQNSKKDKNDRDIE